MVALTLGCISGLHVFWALGGKWGGTAAVPSRPGGPALFAPSPVATLAVAALLAVAAWITVVAGGIARPIGPRWLYAVGAWGVGLVLTARAIGDFHYVGIFKRVRGTSFAALDDRYFTPLCLVLGIAVVWVALQTNPWHKTPLVSE